MDDPRPERVKAAEEPSRFRPTRLQLQGTVSCWGLSVTYLGGTLAGDPGQHPLNLSLSISDARRERGRVYLESLEGDGELFRGPALCRHAAGGQKLGAGVQDTPGYHSTREFGEQRFRALKGGEGDACGWSTGRLRAGPVVCSICQLSNQELWLLICKMGPRTHPYRPLEGIN